MLDVSTNVFPNNVIALLKPLMLAIDATDNTVLSRPLRNTDPNQSIGIFPSIWGPDENSHEMGHQTPHEPTLGTYTVGIQGLVLDGDEERGLALHAIFGKKIRTVLYRNTSLAVSLPALTVTEGSSVERVTRWGVTNQRFINNEINGNWIYLSTLEFWVETVVQ